MKLDLDRYSINRKFIQNWYKANKEFDLNSAISMWATTIHCPCVALAFFIGESEGYSEELIYIIKGLIKFYDYKEILGQKEGSPFLTFGKDDDIKEKTEEKDNK